MKTRLVLVSLIGSLVVGLAALPGGAIINGRPDGGGHPNVGLLAFDPDGEGPVPPFILCTGSVLADDAFLTAAHCITAPFVPPGSQWVVSLQAGGPGDTVYEPGFIPEDFPLAVTAPAVRSIGVAVHPKFDPRTRKNDVAVVRFPAGTFAGVDPVVLPGLRQLDRLLARNRLDGRELTLVGYGADLVVDEDQTRLFAPGYRQVGAAPFEGLTGHSLLLRGTDEGGLCVGDSGSPQLLVLHDAELAVSVQSRGVCGGGAGFEPGVSRSQRLDTPAVQRFLAKVLRPAT